MDIELFNPVSYTGTVASQTWPSPPRFYDPKAGMDSMQMCFEQCEAAFNVGFDSLNFAEHHYSTAQLSPDPITFAGMVGQRLPEATISVLGTDLPLHNPVRVAEAYAMLDNLLGGRLGAIGLLRGTPNEYLTYGTNPWESRESFDEGVELFIRALTEPEPFGWEGRHYRFRNVSIWPQPVQKPHPRILLSGNSPTSARFAAEHGCDIGFSFMDPAKAAASANVYRQTAADLGWQTTPENILYRKFCYVAETDEQASADVANYGWPGSGKLFSSNNPAIGAVMATAGAAAAGAPKGVPLDPSKAPRPVFAPPFVGSPQTVLDQIRAAHDLLGFGRLEVVVIGADGRMPHERVMSSIELMGRTVVPALHADSFIVPDLFVA